VTTNAPQHVDRRLPDRLTLDRSALVVIDLQERFRDLIHGMDQVLERSQRLIGFCRQLEIPVLVTEQYPRGLGVTVSEIREACRPFTAFEKNSFSCAGGKGFLEALRATKRNQVVLCGIETHVCVYQTACDLLRDGFQVALAADAVSSCRPADRELALQRLRHLGADIMGSQMIMFEMLRAAGTPEFKRVAAFLKN
jgi:nicotinamidase-related amidase